MANKFKGYKSFCGWSEFKIQQTRQSTRHNFNHRILPWKKSLTSILYVCRLGYKSILSSSTLLCYEWQINEYMALLLEKIYLHNEQSQNGHFCLDLYSPLDWQNCWFFPYDYFSTFLQMFCQKLWETLIPLPI